MMRLTREAEHQHQLEASEQLDYDEANHDHQDSFRVENALSLLHLLLGLLMMTGWSWCNINPADRLSSSQGCIRFHSHHHNNDAYSASADSVNRNMETPGTNATNGSSSPSASTSAPNNMGTSSTNESMLAQRNTIKVRGSTMDAFRARTKQWRMSAGQVDADSNFRPIQSNPNCVYTCSDDAWCPGLDYPACHYEEDLEDGPSNWPNIDGGELCGHEQQSPILIDPTQFDDGDSCEDPLLWHVDHSIYDWTVTHKGEGGHTLSVYSADAKSDVYLENAFGTNGAQHEKYKFYSLHFHWVPGNQNGSEHMFEGSTTTFEVHFVHYSSDYDGVTSAVAAWEALSEQEDQDMHTLGVVGFLFEEVGDDEDFDESADGVLLQFTSSGMDEVWSNASGSASLSFRITDLVDVDSLITGTRSRRRRALPL